MTKEEANELLQFMADEGFWFEDETGNREFFPCGEERAAIDIAIKSLQQTADKNCSQCLERGKCAIYDNFNIDYCSDWRNV